MLDHLHDTVAQALSREKAVVLATCGAAGLQAGRFPCQEIGTRLYLLAPGTAELLHNLAAGSPVVVLGSGWQGRGSARCLDPAGLPDSLPLLERPDSRWSVLIEVTLTRFERLHLQGWGCSETIDLE